MTPSVCGPALSSVLDGPARHLLDGSPVATAAIDPRGARHEPLVVLRPDGSRVAVCAAVHRADGPPGDDAPTWLSLLARDEPRPAADAHAPLSDVVRAAGVVILGVDADGRIVRVDGDSDCVLGHADEALLRRTLHEVIAGGDAAPHAAEATRRMLADGAPPRLDGLTTELPARDGRPRVVE